MTHDTKRAPRRTAIPAAALATGLLAGCSTGHIGESWQCPLAEAGTCDSVAAADPAVPDPAAARATALAEPLWRARATETDTIAAPSCAAGCDGGLDPFAWLGRLLGGEGEESGAPGLDPGSMSGAGAAAGGTASAGTGPERADTEADNAQIPSESSKTVAKTVSRPVEATVPAESGPAQDGPEAGDLRTGEIVARIWIAPFVDANGVYREASHVRVVLEPAGWRLR